VLSRTLAIMAVVAAGAPHARAQNVAGSAPAASSVKSSGIEQIVVTATKTRTLLQKTPAAVTALSGVTLTQKGLTTLRDVQADVPSARFQLEGNSVQVFLRGVGSNLDFGNIDQLVGFNVNGVYIPREGTSAPLFDVATLEALPGPQGTLYGRGSLGGTVNLTTNRPTHILSTSGVLEVGNYGLVHFTGVQNVPVQPDLAVRVAIDEIRHDGYITDGSDSQQDLSGRIAGLYTPNQDTTLYTWVSGVDRSGSPPNLVNKGFNPATGMYDENAFLHSDPWDNSRTGPLAIFAPFGQAKPEPQVYHNYIAGAQLDYNLGGITLTEIPSYFYLDSNNRYFLGGIDSHKEDFYSEYTEELRASGTLGPVKFIGGLYYYNQHGRSYYFLVPFGVYDSDITHNVKEGEAVFGQATYSVSDRLRLTGGARFSLDQRNAAGFSEVGPADFNFSHDYHNIDYKVSAEYDVTKSVLAYGAVQTSYVPGTFNEAPSTPTFKNAVSPSYLTAFSAGLKTRFFNDTLQINDEVFYYIYRDLQIQAYDLAAVFNPIINATKTTIPGDQLDVIYKPDFVDQFNFNLAYNHERFDSFTVPSDHTSYNGYQPPYASDWTIAAGLQHDFQFPNAGYLRARVDTRFESSYYADFVHHPGTRQDGYDKTDLTLTYFSESGKWTLAAWVKNISNVAVIAATAFAGIPGPATAYLEDPRTFGGRLTFNF
jgi:iron complex outermembrane receptor protein